MKKILFSILLLSLFLVSGYSTHNRAGEITYRQISEYTFEFTITTFTYTLSIVEKSGGRPYLPIQWGDNTSSNAPRCSSGCAPVDLPDYYRKNTYIINHTFPGPGVYEIVMEDPNRNYGVLNIPNSVNVVFSVKTTMIVNPQIGPNNTPVLLNDPIDKGAVGRIFIHNPGAFDYDGDSLSYKLATCSEKKGKPIAGYSLPRSSNKTIYVDSINGNLVWDAPEDTGIFNVAMNIEEWRKGVKIGNIVRDMQIEIHQSNNRPPVNPHLPDTCVEAGTLINFSFTSTDPDLDGVKDTLTGGPFILKTNPAKFSQLSSVPGAASYRFTWQTDYNHVRKQPYTVVVKSTDNYAKLRLVDIDNFRIRVLAPAPKNVQTFPANNAITIKWNKTPCKSAIGYTVYRADSPKAFTVDKCEGGIPPGKGYVPVGTTKSIDDSSFMDKNVNLGVNYCYRVVAIFADGGKSYPSEETCATLVPGNPALIMASVTKIDPANGEIYLSWIKPVIPDTIKGPFEYTIMRANSIENPDFQLIYSFQTNNLNDTVFIDKNVNTIHFPYYYKVELLSDSSGTRYLIGKAETASTLYPDLYASDNQITVKFGKDVPWINDTYVIYRQNLQTGTFDSIASVKTDTADNYVDKGLANGQTYRYRLKSYGYRILDKAVYNTINWSHINSSVPLDTIPPCAPILQIHEDCQANINRLTWNNPNNSKCADDVVKYNIYYGSEPNAKLNLIYTTNGPNDTTFNNKPSDQLRGCYAVTAIDSFNNESPKTNKHCVDTCSGYGLPNVFTPNNDGYNDVYIAFNRNDYVKKVEMKIFNRWGKLVFQTTDPYINWDGKDLDSKQYVSTGVYYYICVVYEPRLTGIEVRNFSGFIHVYRPDSGKKNIE